jgi:hypothetical protein
MYLDNPILFVADF